MRAKYGSLLSKYVSSEPFISQLLHHTRPKTLNMHLHKYLYVCVCSSSSILSILLYFGPFHISLKLSFNYDNETVILEMLHQHLESV